MRIVLDTETTGLYPEVGRGDEILSLSMIDGDGEVLLDRMYKPRWRKRWDEAARINGIWPHDVAKRPTITGDIGEISGILADTDEIVVYNASFDLLFLMCAGISIPEHAKITDTMLEFARAYGEWANWADDWKWQKLSTAARVVGHEWTGKAHGSLADARATLAVQRWLDARPRGAPSVCEESRRKWRAVEWWAETYVRPDYRRRGLPG